MIFTIKVFDGTNKDLHYDDSNYTIEEKIDLLQKYIFNYVVFNYDFYSKLNKIENLKLPKEVYLHKLFRLQSEYEEFNIYNYCNRCWLWTHRFDKFQLNYEDRVKSLLDRCGTFLLLGNYRGSGITTTYKHNQIINNEDFLSNLSTEISDLFYSNSENKDYTAEAKRSNVILANEVLLGNVQTQNNRIDKRIKPKVMKRYKDSQYYKLKQLYRTDDIRIFKLHKLKNKDINYTYWKDSTEKFPEIIEPHNKKLLDKKTKESMCAKDYKKLANKPFRNLHGENLYEYRPHTIKGNKKGIIDRSKPYKWEWSYVWADNVFEFDGSKYRIDDSVEQYQGKLTKMNRKKVPDMEVRYEMDKILVFEQDGKRYYFDQKIDRIDNDLIHAI